MPLNKTCSQHLASNLFVLPYYGHGWTRQDLNAPSPTQLDSLGPEPFHIRLDELIHCNQQIEGFSGNINEPHHNFNGYWCCCLLRSTEECDFSERPGQYMVWITKRKYPVFPAPYPEKPLFEWVQFDKNEFGLCGFGTVALAVQWIQDIHNRTMDSRQLVKEQN